MKPRTRKLLMAGLVLLGGAVEGKLAQTPEPKPFVDIEWHSKWRGKLPDEPVLVDPVYATTRNFVGRPLDGYWEKIAWSYETIIDDLIDVNKNLKPQGLQLLVKDAYRPVSASKDMVWWADKTNPQKLLGNPEFLDVYVAPGMSDHNMGRAIDLTLATYDPKAPTGGDEIWMGSVFDEFNENANFNKYREVTTADDKWAYADRNYFVHQSKSIGQLRKILKQQMESHSYKPCPECWWHFSRSDLPSKAYDTPISKIAGVPQ